MFVGCLSNRGLRYKAESRTCDEDGGEGAKGGQGTRSDNFEVMVTELLLVLNGPKQGTTMDSSAMAEANRFIVFHTTSPQLPCAYLPYTQ